MVVTFIITLVVTALISIIITSIYYKHLIDHIKESVISKEVDPHEDVKRHDPVNATILENNITMKPNPAYGFISAIKIDTNPAYATTS